MKKFDHISIYFKIFQLFVTLLETETFDFGGLRRGRQRAGKGGLRCIPAIAEYLDVFGICYIGSFFQLNT